MGFSVLTVFALGCFYGVTTALANEDVDRNVLDLLERICKADFSETSDCASECVHFAFDYWSLHPGDHDLKYKQFVKLFFNDYPMCRPKMTQVEFGETATQPPPGTEPIPADFLAEICAENFHSDQGCQEICHNLARDPPAKCHIDADNLTSEELRECVVMYQPSCISEAWYEVNHTLPPLPPAPKPFAPQSPFYDQQRVGRFSESEEKADFTPDEEREFFSPEAEHDDLSDEAADSETADNSLGASPEQHMQSLRDLVLSSKNQKVEGTKEQLASLEGKNNEMEFERLMGQAQADRKMRQSTPMSQANSPDNGTRTRNGIILRLPKDQQFVDVGREGKEPMDIGSKIQEVKVASQIVGLRSTMLRTKRTPPPTKELKASLNVGVAVVKEINDVSEDEVDSLCGNVVADQIEDQGQCFLNCVFYMQSSQKLCYSEETFAKCYRRLTGKSCALLG